jgi:hypothetical protein
MSEENVVLIPHDDAGEHAYPMLHKLLNPGFDGKGKQNRLGGSLSVRVDGGMYLVTVNLPSEKASASMQLPSLCDLLDQADTYFAELREWGLSWDEKKKLKQRLTRGQ